MTTQQPEAFRLADALDLYATGDAHQRDIEQAADELRRLHESNTELLAALKEAVYVCIWPSAALSSAYEQACEAIAKAERTTP
jgi:hypothetical protein